MLTFFRNIWNAQKNATALDRLHSKTARIVYLATDGMMSLSTYPIESIRLQIEDCHERNYDQGYADAKKEYERPRANGRFLPSFSPGDRVKAVRTAYDGGIQKDTVYTVMAFEPRHRSGIPCLRLEEKPDGAFDASLFAKAKQTVHPATLKLLKRIEDAGFVKATDIEISARKMLLERHFCVPLKRKIGEQYVRVLQLDEPGSHALKHKGFI